MATGLANLLSDLDEARNNPTLGQRKILQYLKDVTGGKVDVVDASNPFVFGLEAATVSVANFLSRCNVNTRKQYPRAAMTDEDLYLHMSDRDYIGRFALPSRCDFLLVLRKDELINKLVLDPETGYRKLVIPKFSHVDIEGIVYSLEYPIEIRMPSHGGLQVVYDTSELSPLMDLETNQIEVFDENIEGERMISFFFTTIQYQLTRKMGTLQASRVFRMTEALVDQYYTSRVYVENDQGGWTEIYTTHTDQVYDVMKMTAVLRVENNTLSVTIPQIYTNTLARNYRVRVDIYQTKGAVLMDMSGYDNSKFTSTFSSPDSKENDEFVAPWKNMQTRMVYSQDIATGGRAALTFEELRERVIQNSVGALQQPITNVQIKNALIDKGYDIIKNVDLLTNRVFLATRALPAPSNPSLITAAAASIQTAILSMEEAVKVGTVIDNGTSITITPDTIYQNVDGKLNLVNKSVVDGLLALPPERRALAITNGGYFYSPWHYVLDLTRKTSQTEFDVRAYYLDDAQIDSKVFMGENATTLLQVTAYGQKLIRTATGYKLQISTKSSDAFKNLDDTEIFVQLAFRPVGERDRAYQNGVLIGKDPNTKERVYEFDLSTNFNVTQAGGLQMTEFNMYTTDPKEFGAALNAEFDIFFATSRAMDVQWELSNIDSMLGHFLLPAQIAAITHEKLRTTLGKELKNLWREARSLVFGQTYKTHLIDVPLVYEKDVYKVDPATNTPILIVNGQYDPQYEHRVGDPVLDVNGQQLYKYRVGDPMQDEYGNPIPADPRTMYRQIDFMLIEAPYYFATDTVAPAYRKEMTDILVKWITSDLASINPVLLEQTKIYFYPKTSTGIFDVLYGSSLTTSINAGQAFKVDLSVPANVYQDEDLKTQLTRRTIEVIGQAMMNRVVSMSSITEELRKAYGTDVIDVRITGLGGESNFPVITILEETNRCSIRKKLVAQPDGTLIVQEDVTINFVRHVLNN